MIKRYPGLKDFIHNFKDDHPNLKVLPYSQPPSVTFYDTAGNIQEKVMFDNADTVAKIRSLFHQRGI